ncbi:MAG: phage holin family protein [Betaproteobacteria bacterium]|nr:phage holin family protein [Betaproteobacteria bacterium]
MGNTPHGESGNFEAGRSGGGLFATLKGVAAALVSTGRTRLELLGNEIEEEKLRALRLLLTALAMVFCVGVGVLLAVAFFAVVFWEYRGFVIGGFAALFIVLGAFFFRAMKQAAQRSEPLFASSLSELEEDLRQLKAAARNEPATH